MRSFGHGLNQVSSISRSSAAAEMGDRLATVDMGRKQGLLCPFPWRELGSRHNVAWGEAYLRTKWHLDPTNRLATLHQRHRQTDNGPVAEANRFTNGRQETTNNSK